MNLKEFENLLESLENKSDPFYREKYKSKLRELKSWQIQTCPCNLHTLYDDPLYANLIQQNLPTIIKLLKRANAFTPFVANGTTIQTNKTIEHFPVVHVDRCACEPPEKQPMSNKMKKHVIKRYTTFLETIRNNFK